jgi:predicted ATPase
VNCRRVQDALEYAEATIGLALEYGFSTVLPQMMNIRGWALVHHGRVEEGFEQISRGMALHPPAVMWWLRHSRLLADACLHTQRAAEGLRAVSTGLQMLAGTRRHFEEPELHRLKGELLLRQTAGASEEAESSFHKAVEIAQRQQAKSWELRATMSLACLLRDTKRRDEARRMLSEIYGWFTEGFDTPDLRDARALLEQLGE